MEIGQRVLLDGFESRGELLEAISGFRSAIRGGFGPFGLACSNSRAVCAWRSAFSECSFASECANSCVIVGFLDKGREQSVGSSVTVAEATS